MCRISPACLALAAALAVATAAPVPEEKPAPSYFPTKKGTRWVYKTGDATVTQQIADSERKGGTTHVTVECLENGKSTLTERVAITPKGLFVTHVNKDELASPVCLLKYPVRPGDAWDMDAKLYGQASTAAFTVKGEEVVEVPAGKYRAVRVDGEGTANGRKVGITRWLARDIGIIKVRYWSDAEGVTVRELKEFTPGRD